MLVSIHLIKKLQLEKDMGHLFEHTESRGKQACVMKPYCLCKLFWIMKSLAGILVTVQGLSYCLYVHKQKSMPEIFFKKLCINALSL